MKQLARLFHKTTTINVRSLGGVKSLHSGLCTVIIRGNKDPPKMMGCRTQLGTFSIQLYVALRHSTQRDQLGRVFTVKTIICDFLNISFNCFGHFHARNVSVKIKNDWSSKYFWHCTTLNLRLCAKINLPANTYMKLVMKIFELGKVYKPSQP